MKSISNARLAALSVLLAALLTPPGYTTAAPVAAPAPPAAQGGNVGINGFFSVDPAQQGSTFQAAIVMDIPRGLHVNSNRPLGKYAIPTKVSIDAPRGLRVSAVSYPRGAVRTFRFGGAAAERLSVYEGNAIIRFSVTVPPGQELGVARIRARVEYQSCSDEVCFPPARRELTLPIAIVDRGTASRRINQRYFGGGRRRQVNF